MIVRYSNPDSAGHAPSNYVRLVYCLAVWRIGFVLWVEKRHSAILGYFWTARGNIAEEHRWECARSVITASH